jgi:hypothetical protein
MPYLKESELRYVVGELLGARAERRRARMDHDGLGALCGIQDTHGTHGWRLLIGPGPLAICDLRKTKVGKKRFMLSCR